MPKLNKNKKSVVEREVVYSKITADVCQGETAISAEDAKELLGWEEVLEGNGTYIREVYSLGKVRARCKNNSINRPLYTGVIQTLRQEILRGRWLLNGEPIIIGSTGLLLNGQHTLLALVLADLEWNADHDRWGEYWSSPPVINKVVVSGVDEGDATVNTMDTCKPRSLADVIYRSAYFASLTLGERRRAARIADYSIRLLWHRTGAGLDAFAPRRTHAESLDFIAHHPRLLDAVKHVQEEDGEEGKLAQYLSPGYAAGLLYLMGCSTTDPDAYRHSAHPDESSLDWANWAKACDFFVLLAAGSKETNAVRAVMARSLEEGGLSNAERWAIISNAWLAYSDGDKITKDSLELQYVENDEGVRHLAEHPSVGGIDLGDPSTVDEDNVEMADPEPKEIEKAAAKAKKKGLKQMASGKTPVKPRPVKLGQPSRANTRWAKGDIAWVTDSEGDHFLGQLVEDPWDCDDEQCRAMVRTSKGEEWEVFYSELSLERPGSKTLLKAAVHFPKARVAKRGKSSTEYKVGDHPWVRSKDGEHWRGKVIEMSKNGAKLKVDTGFIGASTIRMVWLKDLCREQPDGSKTL